MNPTLGAVLQKDGSCSFCVWAPHAKELKLKIHNGAAAGLHSLERDAVGNQGVVLSGVAAGDRYSFLLNGQERPDPASRFQPEGVHGPSAVVDLESFRWTDSRWKGLELRDMVFYEAHVGTFTPQGTFEAMIPRLSALQKLGITCLEIMPVAQFPGARNWGYDGVNLYAVQNSYGGPIGFQRLVDACHARGLAVCLDVVYNHYGPEGNYWREFGPHFTSRHHTPWGDAVNYDSAGSDPVRRFVIENAIHWIRHFHVDALRLDAVHGITDTSAEHILKELNDRVHEEARRLKRTVTVIAESDLNDVRILNQPRTGGYGLDAQWSDDFHHAVHTALTDERKGYYADFEGVPHLAKAIRDGFVYDGCYSPFRGRRHGCSASHISKERLVVSLQNHDQVGNRAWGERLSTLVPFEAQKLALALLLSVPMTPLLFMGEEYGETAPFRYFTDHGDRDLVEAVRKGRKEEFVSFGWDDIPDPQSPETFSASQIDWEKRSRPGHRAILELTKDLLTLRRRHASKGSLGRGSLQVEADPGSRGLAFRRKISKGRWFGGFFSFSPEPVEPVFPWAGSRKLILDTSSKRYEGLGRTPAPYQALLFLMGS